MTEKEEKDKHHNLTSHRPKNKGKQHDCEPTDADWQTEHARIAQLAAKEIARPNDLSFLEGSERCASHHWWYLQSTVMKRLRAR